MATKWYFHDSSNNTGEDNPGPTDEQSSTWTADYNASGYDTPRDMDDTKGLSEVEVSVTHTAKSDWSYHRVFCSPLLAQQTLSSQGGYIRVGWKASDADQFNFAINVYVWRNGSNVATLYSNTDGSPGEVQGSLSWSMQWTEASLQDKDRICFEWWYQGGSQSGGDTVYCYYDGTTEITGSGPMTDCASCIVFNTDTLTEYTPPTTAPTFKEWSWGAI